MTLLWLWILAAPGAVPLADCRDARLYLRALARGQSFEFGERATRERANRVSAPVVSRVASPTTAAEPSASIKQVENDARRDSDEIARSAGHGNDL